MSRIHCQYHAPANFYQSGHCAELGPVNLSALVKRPHRVAENVALQ